MRISGNARARGWCRRTMRCALIGLIASTAWADSLPSRAVQVSSAVKISERTGLFGNTAAPAARFELDARASAPLPVTPTGQQKYLPVGSGRILPWRALDLATLTWSSTDADVQFATVE